MVISVSLALYLQPTRFGKRSQLLVPVDVVRLILIPDAPPQPHDQKEHRQHEASRKYGGNQHADPEKHDRQQDVDDPLHCPVLETIRQLGTTPSLCLAVQDSPGRACRVDERYHVPAENAKGRSP